MSSRQWLAFCTCALAAVGCSVDKIPTNGPDTPSEGKIGLFEPHSTPDAGPSGPAGPCICVRPGTTGPTAGAGGSAGSSGSTAAGSGGNNALAAIAGIGLPSPVLLPALDVIGGAGASGVSGSAAAVGGMSGNLAAVSGTGGSAGAGGPDAPRGCTMSVNFTSVPPSSLTGRGNYDLDGNPHSFAVVWVETPDGVLVKTLGLWGRVYWVQNNLLRYWPQNGMCCQPDVTAMATLTSHSPEMLTWDCTDLNMNTVPDGDYVLWLEAQVDEANHIPALSFNFTKGPAAWTLNPPPEPPQTAMSITYTPN